MWPFWLIFIISTLMKKRKGKMTAINLCLSLARLSPCLKTLKKRRIKNRNGVLLWIIALLLARTSSTTSDCSRSLWWTSISDPNRGALRFSLISRKFVIILSYSFTKFKYIELVSIPCLSRPFFRKGSWNFVERKENEKEKKKSTCMQFLTTV